MEIIDFGHDGNVFNINGYPNAVKLVKLNSDKCLKLSHLTLHKYDLEFARECLAEFDKIESHSIVKNSLWNSAIIHTLKCFGKNESRFSLLYDEVFVHEDEIAKKIFKFFKNLRDKNIVHDENSYTQSIPCAILRDRSQNEFIEKVICFTANGLAYSDTNVINLKLIIEKSLKWVINEFDNLCVIITNELHQLGYDAVYNFPVPEYQKPKPNEVSKKRNKH